MSRLSELSGGDDDPFGPGSDLVFSLFALLLMLFVIGLAWQQISSVIERVIAVTEEPPQRFKNTNLTALTEGGKQPAFEEGKAYLLPDAIILLDGILKTVRSELRQPDARRSYNQLLIIGYSSPESSQYATAGLEPNFKLSQDRARAVFDYLRGQGIPYECMTLAGGGWSRSLVLREYLNADPAHRSIESFEVEAQLQRRRDGAFKRRLEAERRVVVDGIYREDSPCRLR